MNSFKLINYRGLRLIMVLPQRVIFSLWDLLDSCIWRTALEVGRLIDGLVGGPRIDE